MNPNPNVRPGPAQAPQRRDRGGAAPARKNPFEERDILDEEVGEDEIELEDEQEDEETD
jgi:hypothetical protein